MKILLCTVKTAVVTILLYIDVQQRMSILRGIIRTACGRAHQQSTEAGLLLAVPGQSDHFGLFQLFEFLERSFLSSYFHILLARTTTSADDEDKSR
jgi:hypothetical protein